MHLLRELNKLPHGKQNKCSINVNYIKVAKYLTTLLDKIRFKHVFIMLMTWGDSMISFRKKKKRNLAYCKHTGIHQEHVLH